MYFKRKIEENLKNIIIIKERKMKKYYLLSIVTFLLFSLFLGAIIGNAQDKDFAFYAFPWAPFADWDPSVENSNGIPGLSNIYETLLRYDPLEDKIIKFLATDYTTSSDGLTWTFYLRKGVKFHDGTELNADAVKFSIDRTMRINKGPAYIWEAVDKINVVDNYTVEFRLKYPTPLDLICAAPAGAFIMSPTTIKSHPDNWLSEGNEAGSGPYKLENFKRENEEIVLTWFEDYWRGWEGKHFKKAVIKGVTEVATRRLLIESGEADFTGGLLFGDIATLQKSENVNVSIGPSFLTYRIALNTQKEHLNNKLVRQALAYAFPYQDVISYCFGGYARQGKGPVSQALLGYSEGLFQYKYNLDKAKQLLEEAGYANGGFKFLITYCAGDEIEKKTAELFKASLAKLNIDLEIRGMPWESQWALAKDNNPEKRQDLWIQNWWPDFPSPQSWLYPLFYSEEEPFFNMSYYKNKEFDNLLDKAWRESGIDRNKSVNTYIEAQKILVEDCPEIFVCDHEDVFYSNKTFKGYKNNPAYPRVLYFYDTYREK